MTVKRPDGFKLPDHKELATALPTLVKAATTAFADPPAQFSNIRQRERVNERRNLYLVLAGRYHATPWDHQVNEG